MCCNDLWNHVIKCVFTIINYKLIIYVVVNRCDCDFVFYFVTKLDYKPMCSMEIYVYNVHVFSNLQTISDRLYFGFYNFLITTSGSHNCPFPTHGLTHEYSHGWNVMYHLAWHAMNLDPQLFESWSIVPIIWHFYDKC
jgi:hypothetical protein